MTSVILISDIHFDREHEQAVALAYDTIKNLSPDALVIAGDLTQRGKHKEFDRAREWLDQFQLPHIVVPGNHDTPLLNLYERVNEPFARYAERFGDVSKTLCIGGVRFWGLNTSRGWQARRNWAEGVVNLDDLAMIEEGAIQDDAPFQALVCHHPFRGVPGAPLRTSTRRGKRASVRLADSHIQLLLTGHVHQPTVKLWEEENGGSYLAIGAGTLSDRLRSWPPSFTHLNFEENTLTVEAHLLEGDMFRCVPQGKFIFTADEQGVKSVIKELA